MRLDGGVFDMRILCTGAGGYIGSMLVPSLVQSGYDVIALDNFMWRQAPFNHICMHKNFEVIRGDARDGSIVLPLLDRVDAVIPLAALVGAPLCDADKNAAMETNYYAVKMLARQAADKLFIIPITNSGYGVGEPGKECTEETPLRPISLYGQSKVDAEKAAFEYCPNAVSLRLATVFGMSPRMRLDLLVNDFVYRAVNDRAVVLFESHFKRNYIHIRDVVRAFLFVLRRHKDMAGKAFNVGLSDANLSKRELCERIKLQLPKFTFIDAPIGEDPDKRDYIVSNARIEGLGFRPVISLDLGIAELVKGFGYLRNSVHGNIV
jgi:nucleoside-diphosphate-sugar epimerase